MLSSLCTDPPQTHALLFIEHSAAGSGLNALLTERGITVTMASTVDELQHAVQTGGFDVAVTRTIAISLIRRIAQLPVVNVDTFIFLEIDFDPAKAPRKRFDASAFVDRVLAVSHTAPRLENLPPRLGDRL